ncbi:MAG: wax ester/triacylglycerol synthase domain-containing protein, partial [Actinomycetota bacterium]
RLYQEPMDRTRPLWRFVVIGGVEGGRGAIYALTHHVIADGIGQLRMAELYQQLSREEPAPDPVDLDAFLAERLEAHRAAGHRDDVASTMVAAGRDTAGHLLRRQAGIGRRLLGEVMLWPADTSRIADRAGDVAATVSSTAQLLNPPKSDTPTGSPLWKTRSRHRHLEHIQVPLDGLKAASKGLGGSINDGFMIALIEGAHRYHAKRDIPVDTFNTSFVVSTRSDNTMGGNSFTPVPVRVNGKAASLKTRMRELRQAAGDARDRSDRSGGISGLSTMINLLPTSVVTRTARAQARAIDFATSNLRGAPFPLFCAGAEVEATVCMGPLAGTAINVTALSYNGTFDIGLFIDPVAVEDPADYRRCVESAFADLLATVPTPTTNGSAPATDASNPSAEVAPAEKKQPAKKKAAKKPAAKKKSTKKKASASPSKRAAKTNGAGRATTAKAAKPADTELADR